MSELDEKEIHGKPPKIVNFRSYDLLKCVCRDCEADPKNRIVGQFQSWYRDMDGTVYVYLKKTENGRNYFCHVKATDLRKVDQ